MYYQLGIVCIDGRRRGVGYVDGAWRKGEMRSNPESGTSMLVLLGAAIAVYFAYTSNMFSGLGFPYGTTTNPSTTTTSTTTAAAQTTNCQALIAAQAAALAAQPGGPPPGGAPAIPGCTSALGFLSGADFMGR